MLSYRHIYHAGNHADVLKHTVLLALLDYLTAKAKSLVYIETHAGAGRYPLSAAMAQRNCEYAGGVQRVLGAVDPPPAAARYRAAVAGDCGAQLRGHYPGSPLLAARALRADDHLQLFELQREDALRLRRSFKGDARTTVHCEDGLRGLIGLLPPPTRRALVLVDPSYEVKSDYREVPSTLAAALKRFATGVYGVWYPLLERRECRELPRRLTRLAPRWLQVELQLRGPGEGMYGSGMVVINPPWVLRGELEVTLPWLTRVLAQDAGSWRLRSAGME